MTISAVIPALDEESSIAMCLMSLAEQNLADVVVSTDADTTSPRDGLSRTAAVFDADPELVASCGAREFVDGPWWARPDRAAVFGTTAWSFRRARRVSYASATNIAFRRAARTGDRCSTVRRG